MSIRKYQICTKCVMDTSDPNITFDDLGVCNHCRNFENNIRPIWFPDERGEPILAKMIQEMKSYGQDKEYDCILGLSGGVDSSYLAYAAVKKFGLRPLVVHVDAGWNSEIAVKNIENIVKKLGLDLYTFVVDWNEMQDLQLAFFKAGVHNQDIPQDHAFAAVLYNWAAKNNIKYVLNGSNMATESILPSAWVYNNMDLKHIKAIHKQFGQRKLKKFPVLSFFKYYIYYPYVKGVKVLKPLNYMHYHKGEAMEVLQNELDWKYYGGKHFESRFTKYFQAHYLPVKYGFDKRRAHLSSLIVSGQYSREKALKDIEKPLYNEVELREDEAYMAKKMGVSLEEFKQIFHAKPHLHEEYPNSDKKVLFMYKVAKMLKRIVK
mgnify:CR=1 FL=1